MNTATADNTPLEQLFEGGTIQESNKFYLLRPGNYYEMLDRAPADDEIDREIYDLWAKYLRMKGHAYAITKHTDGAGRETIRFWVEGQQAVG